MRSTPRSRGEPVKLDFVNPEIGESCLTTMCFTGHTAAAGAPAYLMRNHDAPLQEKLGHYEERPRG